MGRGNLPDVSVLPKPFTKSALRPTDAYDELRLPNGELRAHYGTLGELRERESASKVRTRLRMARNAFHDDAEVLVWPRLFTVSENRSIRRGVAQRGRAIQLFLHDHYFGHRTYARAGVISTAAVERFLVRHGERDAGKLLSPAHLCFWYAPDVVRDAEGDFRVIEDNTGFVGGIGDLAAIRAAASALGVPRANTVDPRAFYEKLAGPRSSRGKKILISYPRRIRETHEDSRLAHALAPFAVEEVTHLGSLRVRNGQLYHRGERVHTALLNVDVADIEPEHPATYARYLLNGIAEVGGSTAERGRALFRAHDFAGLRGLLSRSRGTSIAKPGTVPGVAGFWDAFRNGSFRTNAFPGMEFTNDKGFYASVESLIRFYLGAEPILKSIETHSLGSRARRDLIFERPRDWVIKGVGGKCGKEVWIGRTLSSARLTALRKRVDHDPENYVAQTYLKLSRLDGHLVDARTHAIVTPRSVTVSPFPWGRASPVGGSGKVNVSAGGGLTAIAVVSTKRI